MEDLIKALQIFLKYGNPAKPTCCTLNVLTIVGIDPLDVSHDDIAALEELGFLVNENEEDNYFYSFRFGTA